MSGNVLFLGLDISISGTGLVLLDEEYNIYDKTKLSVSCQGIERLYHLENLLLKFLDDRSITFSCLEGPSYQSEKGQLFQLGEWAGIVKLNLFKKGIDFIPAAPSQLKKYILGKALKGSRKELVILDIYKKYGEEIRDNDIADAYVLSRIAGDYYNRYILKQDVDVKVYQNEVLEKIYKKEKEKKILV